MQPTKKTTFTRKSKPAGGQVTGVTLSSNNLVVVSTGVPSLDEILGGAALGSIFLVEEDHPKTYSNMLAKCIIAEGVVCGHEVLVATHQEHLTRALPSLVESARTSRANDDGDAELKIAWRYSQKQPKHDCAGSFVHKFDFSKPASEEFIGKASSLLTVIDDLDYERVLSSVRQKVDGAYATATERPSNVLRIVIDGAGSPLWASERGSSEAALNRFLFMLKSIVRPSYAVAFVTVPSFLRDKVHVDRLRRLCDVSIALKAFGEKEKLLSDFKEFHGLIEVEQLSQFNSLGVGNKEAFSDLAFKVHKKQFTVEKLHLPPLFTDNAPDQSSCSQKFSKAKVDDF